MSCTWVGSTLKWGARGITLSSTSKNSSKFRKMYKTDSPPPDVSMTACGVVYPLTDSSKNTWKDERRM